MLSAVQHTKCSTPLCAVALQWSVFVHECRFQKQPMWRRVMHLSSMYLFILCFQHACEISYVRCAVLCVRCACVSVNFIFIGAEFMDCENITFSAHIIHSSPASSLSTQFCSLALSTFWSLISITNFSFTWKFRYAKCHQHSYKLWWCLTARFATSNFYRRVDVVYAVVVVDSFSCRFYFCTDHQMLLMCLLVQFCQPNDSFGFAWCQFASNVCAHAHGLHARLININSLIQCSLYHFSAVFFLRLLANWTTPWQSRMCAWKITMKTSVSFIFDFLITAQLKAHLFISLNGIDYLRLVVIGLALREWHGHVTF